MTKTLQAGEPSPRFILTRPGDTPITNESFAGNNLVIYFYPKDDTSGCTKEAIDFNALKPAFAEAGTKILGVSPDPFASHVKFQAKHKLELDLGSDEDKTMLEAFGVWTEKSMYGRRYMGVERATVLIDREGRIVRVWPKVKVPGHAEEVLAAARELG